MKLTGAKAHEAKINILNDVNGIIKPGRLVVEGVTLSYHYS